MITPYISRENVSSALASLIHSSRELKSNGLRHLLLVDLLLINPALPSGDNMRDYALKELLVSTITSALSEHRAIFLLLPPNQSANINVIRSEIAEAVEQDSINLTIWSLLYYRYVRADLGLSVDALGEALAIHSRTISRYNDDGINLLKERLLDAELSARQAQNRRRLYAALPYPVPMPVFGREHLFQQVQDLLEVISPRHLLVTGEAGIGKTTFVQEVLRREIDANHVDQLIWVEQPPSVHYLRQLIRESIKVENSAISLRDYLALYRVAFIFDGINGLVVERLELEDLLRELGAANVFLINRVHVSLSGIRTHIPLSGIPLGSAYELVSELLPIDQLDEKYEYTQLLYKRFGGNPLAFRLGVGFLEGKENLRAIQNHLDDSLLLQLFTLLGLDAQRAWCVLCLLGSGVGTEKLLVVWNIQYSTLLALLQFGLIDIFEDSVFLSSAARDFVRQHYSQESSVRQLVDKIVEEITVKKLQADTTVLDVVERALLTEFPQLSPVIKDRWIHAACKEGLKRNHWALWRNVLEEYFDGSRVNDHTLLLSYAVCLRRLGELVNAEKLLYELVISSGRSGRFHEQAYALIEWSELARQTGKFGRAETYLQQAKRYAERAHDIDLLQAVELQRAEVLLQQHQSDESLEILLQLSQTAATLSLQSEAQLARGNYELCRYSASQALEMGSDNHATEAKLYTIIGRSYEAQHEHEQMRRYFSMAVTQFERLDDLFSLARSETNLAASLMLDDQFDDAEILLLRSERIQERLGDALGLSVTQHNQHILIEIKRGLFK